MRHTCTGCGRSCHGVKVRLWSDAERQRIIDAAETMGVPDPIVDGRLRMVDAHCVFQNDEGLCGIHAKFGFEAKPVACQQYPLIVLDTELGRRAGIDPSCFTHFGSWRTAPELPLVTKVTNKLEFDAAQIQMEGRVLHALARPFDESLSMLVQDPEHFGKRLVTVIQAADLEAPIHAPEAGQFLRQYMSALIAYIDTLDPETVTVTLSGERAAFTMDIAQRMVGLRLMPSYPLLPGVALLSLVGGIVSDWHHPDDDDAFSATLSTWTRAIRRPAFWGELTPSEEALRILVGG